MTSNHAPRPRAALLLLLLAAVAAVGFWLRPGTTATTPAETAGGAAPATASLDKPSASKAKAPSARPIPPAPLPSLTAPFALIAYDLKARSDAGDPDAACRLAAEFAYCSTREMQRADFDRWLVERQAGLVSATEPQTRSDVATYVDREMTMREGMLDQLTRHCAGSPAATPNDIALQWRRAALLGSPAAMKQYASGNAFRWSSLMDSLPLLATYRGEAEAMALQVARNGDGDMLLILATGYDPSPLPNRSLLAQSVSPDGPRALAMYQRAQAALDALPPEAMALARRQLGARISSLESELSPAERARAAQLLQDEMSGWKAPAFDQERGQRSGGQGDVHRFACGAPPGETVRRREPPAG
ncbi:MAG: hypothetical protein NT046_04240 [Arenimonas sp.]|nr:hypothetical protein [Arenimonas sp.]